MASAWAPLLGKLFGATTCQRQRGDGLSVEPFESALTGGMPGDVLAVGEGTLIPLAEAPLRRRLGELRPQLDSGLELLVAEPAHHGVDWAVFSAKPLADRMRKALSGSAAAAFVIPQHRARGEHKFYFEQYDLDLFADCRL